MQIVIDKNGHPVLDQFSEEGFIDCVLKITDKYETDNLYKLNLRACYMNETVGFDVTVIKDIQAGFDSEMNLIKENVYWKGMTFISTGTESDSLISALANLYDIKNSGIKMRNTETFTCIALHQGELNMADEPIKIKIFGPVLCL